MRSRVGAGAVLALVSLVACAGGAMRVRDAAPAPRPFIGAVPWRAPRHTLERALSAGLELRARERPHVHAHLDVFVNGRPVTVPAGIGIDIDNPAVKRGAGPSYGDIEGCAQPCISELHTHDPTGVLHSESGPPGPNLLGQFFEEWGVRLNATCVGGYCRPTSTIQILVDGALYSGNPARIALTNYREIAIVVGSSPDAVPSRYDPFFA
jgi:hypothetical protein